MAALSLAQRKAPGSVVRLLSAPLLADGYLGVKSTGTWTQSRPARAKQVDSSRSNDLLFFFPKAVDGKKRECHPAPYPAAAVADNAARHYAVYLSRRVSCCHRTQLCIRCASRCRSGVQGTAMSGWHDLSVARLMCDVCAEADSPTDAPH